MNKTKVYNINGEIVDEITLNSDIFGVQLNEGLVQQVVEAYFANCRQVLAHTKDRGEVRGGGRKPWRQKGTGRARHGSNRSPIWVGGGITFGPRNTRNFSKNINKKMKKKALLMCLSDKANSDLLILVDDLKMDAIKTKNLFSILKKLPVLETKIKKIKIKSKDGDKKREDKEVKELAKSLIVIPEKRDNIFLASRNLKNVEVIRADSLNIVDILKYKYLVIFKEGLNVIEQTYLKQ